MSACTYTESRLRPLIDGELSTGEHEKVVRHLDACPSCRAAYFRVHSLVAALQEQVLEDVPDHFSAGLQVRLARHRAARATRRGARFRWPGSSPVSFSPRLRLASGLATLFLLAFCFLAFPGVGAADIVRRAEQSWERIRNYGCEFKSEGVYRGEPREFRQKQFFRRPHDPRLGSEFMLDTEQDYRLRTFVKRDRLIHVVPRGTWEGKGPLVIVRPRQEAEDALPFPFGVVWNGGGNVSLDGLIRQLRQNNARLLPGTDRVGEFECYRLQFSTVLPGIRTPDQYEVWVDRETFLPRRVSWFRDAANHTITTAAFLQVNYDVLPTGTFDFEIPKGGARVIHGDVDPHVMVLPLRPKVERALLADPVSGAGYEAWARSGSMPFPVSSPDWLPEGFRLIRVRARSGTWVDTHWIRSGAGGEMQVLKLVQQDGTAAARADLVQGQEVRLASSGSPIVARLREEALPYRFATLTWRRDGTRFTLSAPGLSVEELQRIAASMAQVTAPPQPAIARTDPLQADGPRGEPSLIPSDVPPASPSAEAPATAPAAPPAATLEAPQMMPEMSDEERPRA